MTETVQMPLNLEAARAPLSMIELITDRNHKLFQERVLEPLDPEFLANVKALGVVQPITVLPPDPVTGKMAIIAGRRRYMAAVEAGLTDIPFIVASAKQQVNQVAVMVSENTARQGVSPLEQAKDYLKLFLENDEDFKRTAKMAGTTQQTIKNYVGLLQKGIPAIIDAIREGKVPISACFGVRSMTPEEQEKHLANLLALYKSNPELVGTKLQKTKRKKDKEAAAAAAATGSANLPKGGLSRVELKEMKQKLHTEQADKWFDEDAEAWKPKKVNNKPSYLYKVLAFILGEDPSVSFEDLVSMDQPWK